MDVGWTAIDPVSRRLLAYRRTSAGEYIERIEALLATGEDQARVGGREGLPASWCRGRSRRMAALVNRAVPQVRRRLRLSVGARQIPLLTLPSGT
jgi:hypothetical protein